jgi:Flp pilus assembly pilin Flp
MAPPLACNPRLRHAGRGLLADQAGLSALEYSVLFIVICLCSVAAWRTLGDRLACRLGAAQQHLFEQLGALEPQTAFRCAAGQAQAASTATRTGIVSALAGANRPPAAPPEAPRAPGIPAPPKPPGPSPKASNPVTGLGEKVDTIVGKSPSLVRDVEELQAAGWQFEYGKPGAGSVTLRRSSKVVVDPGPGRTPESIARTFAHEVGHAEYTPEPGVPPSGLTKEEFVRTNTDKLLADEGAATLSNARARDEIRAKGGPDIGISGTQPKAYAAVYRKLKAGKITEAQARKEIAQLYGKHERTSNTKENYRRYYAKAYQTFWDKKYKGLKPGERAP